MSRELDIEKLKEHKSAGAPFMEFRDPDGDTFYAYAVKPIEDLRNYESKKFARIERHAIVEIVDLKPEGAAVSWTRRVEGKFIEVGSTYTVNFSRHSVLKRETEKLSPIKGKILHIMNRGKRQGKKNAYWDYVIVPVTLEMRASHLLGLSISRGLRRHVDEPEEGDTDL